MKHVKLSHELNAEIIYKLPFGSQIYTQQNQSLQNPASSDKDFICVIPESTGSFVLQFKNEVTNEDITYVGIDQFIDGLKNCSNVEFFEALHTGEGEQFLFDHDLDVLDFYTPRMAKAYLGYARRDLKSNFVDRHFYIMKSIYFAENIISKNQLHPEYVGDDVLYGIEHNTDNWHPATVLSKIDFLRKSLRYV